MTERKPTACGYDGSPLDSGFWCRREQAETSDGCDDCLDVPPYLEAMEAGTCDCNHFDSGHEWPSGKCKSCDCQQFTRLRQTGIAPYRPEAKA